MGWRDRLRKASFRGVRFEVDSESTPVGRRTQTHEFVQRDKPVVEDLGRVTREISLTAFVIGDDCYDQRDKLLNALDTPGPGELIHPWYGRLNVTAVEGCKVSHEYREGRMVRFELLFVEDGEKGYPVGVPNTALQLKAKKQGFLAKLREKFSKAMAVVNLGRAKLNALATAILEPFNVAQTYFAEAMRAYSTLTGFASLVLSGPLGVLSCFTSLTGSSSLSLTSSSAFSGFSDATAALLGKATDAQKLSTAPAYAGDANTAAVAGAVRQLVRNALLCQIAEDVCLLPIVQTTRTAATTSAARAVRATTTCAVPPAAPSLEQQVADPIEHDDVPVVDDVLAVRDAIDAAFWAAQLESEPAFFNELQTVRKACYRHLTAVAQSGVHLVEYTPGDTLPALVLAYRQFADATRADEIVTRNRLNHPGFVPPLPLQLAQE